MRRDAMASDDGEPTLARKVEFLGRREAYPQASADVIRRETHMSWVFLTGDRVYKLKKPVRFPYLDFSTLPRREAACRAEFALNRRLAPDVYLGVVPLVFSARFGLSIGGGGTVVDWLVVMRRLEEDQTLERAILERRVDIGQLNRLGATLVRFYRQALPVPISPAAWLAAWRQSLAYNRRILLDPTLPLPAGLFRQADRVQRAFLRHRGATLARRARERRIVDGHGDLRPEHIWLDDRIRIIDCLEFNPRLRAVDPLDEVAFLSLECERLGAPWAGDHVRRQVMRSLGDGASEALFRFYRCHRATLRARLAIAHLLEPNPRTPEKWPRLAGQYLRIAVADGIRLERWLKTPGDR